MKTFLLLLALPFASANIRGSVDIVESEEDRDLQTLPTLPPTQAPWCLETRYTPFLRLSRKDKITVLTSDMGYDVPSWYVHSVLTHIRTSFIFDVKIITPMAVYLYSNVS